MPVLGSHAEELVTMIASSGSHISTENQSAGVTPEVELFMTPPLTDTIRPKKLKTDRDDTVMWVRNRGKSRLKTIHK